MEPIEIIFGKDFNAKQEIFKNELLKIEKEYIDFFITRKSKFETEKHDRLHNHWFLFNEPPKITFGILKESDIPIDLKKKCMDAFKKIFINS